MSEFCWKREKGKARLIGQRERQKGPQDTHCRIPVRLLVCVGEVGPLEGSSRWQGGGHRDTLERWGKKKGGIYLSLYKRTTCTFCMLTRYLGGGVASAWLAASIHLSATGSALRKMERFGQLQP